MGTHRMYRKKPIIVAATQWFKNGDHPDDRVGEQELDESRLIAEHPEMFHDDGSIGPLPDNPPTYTRLEGAVVGFYLHPPIDPVTKKVSASPNAIALGELKHSELPTADRRPECHALMDDHGWMETLEGGHIVCLGDYIVTGAHGELYPVKPKIFADCFEPVNP